MSDHNDVPPEEKRKKSAWLLIIGLPLIAAVAVAAIFFTSTGENTGPDGRAADERAATPSEGERASEPAETPADEREGGGDSPSVEHPALGDEDAPVVMLEFSDYQ